MSRKSILGSLAVAAMLVFGLAASAAAQTGRLTGVVTDAATGEPLAGAQITIDGTGRGTITGENGRYFILNVQPGTYSISAQLLGYATVRSDNVLIAIDITRTLDFQLPSEAVALQEIIVTAERVPLVETTQTGSSTTLTTRELNALPVTSVEGALALQSGFLEVPQNTDVIAFAETRRNAISPLRIRGGRAGETLTLIDGIPVNNFIFGGPAIGVNRKVVEQIDYMRGGFEPQYGNALSGIVNIATREGGTQLSGALEYQSSGLGSALGSRHDELLGYNLLEGFVAGPVPATNNRLRFMIAGRERSEADRVLMFDDDIFEVTARQEGRNTPHPLDIIRGWRADGFDAERDLFGKLTFYFTPTARLSFSALDYMRQRLPYDFDYMLTGFNPSDACVELGIERDVCDAYYGTAGTARTGYGRYEFISRSSVRLDRTLYSSRWDHTLGRSRYTISGGILDQQRMSCNWLNGVCLEDRFADINFSGRFVAPGITAVHPAAGTDEFFGGEKMRTAVGRLDLESQVTDNHNLQAGIFYQRHDIDFSEARQRGTNDVFVVWQDYAAKPWDAAIYLQDRMEFDFLTVRLGARFDYGRAGGLFFANPLDPTAGTTAREVCSDPSRYQNVSVRVPVRDADGNITGTTMQSMSANTAWTEEFCFQNRPALEEAALIATHDDFAESSLRTQFSPRIGLSFPVTENSNFFFNFGRYSQNPLLNNIYQSTGIGTGAEGIPGGPTIFSTSYTVGWIGNPHLLVERTDAYEIGFQSVLGDNYAFQTTFFTKDQFGLTGLQEARATDVGATYGSIAPRYWVLVNKDFQTVRGFEVGLRRRLADFWSFNLNYTFSQATTNAASPEREAQGQIEEGDPQLRGEYASEIDQPHVFNGTFVFQVEDDTPDFPGAQFLRNSAISTTVRAYSGFPYTPTLTFTGVGESGNLERNSARGPGTFQIDLQANKSWRVANMRYGAFVRVQNLTDRENCIQVFVSTGNCRAGTVDQSRDRQGNDFGSMSTYFDRPGYFGPRRSINAGITVNF
jgi:outer membrane receptor protein involved in Fe transport